MSIIRIAITGPESTGKSMLTAQLAKHYKAVMVAEYAREYLEKLGRSYEYHDILKIAKGQLSIEKAVLKSTEKFLFTDTEAIVTKIWCNVKYGRCHPWILEQIQDHPYDLYLLCNVDLPWEDDPLREHPDKRIVLFNLYQEELVQRKLQFSIISGSGDNRLQEAIKVIDQSF